MRSWCILRRAQRKTTNSFRRHALHSRAFQQRFRPQIRRDLDQWRNYRSTLKPGEKSAHSNVGEHRRVKHGSGNRDGAWGLHNASMRSTHPTDVRLAHITQGDAQQRALEAAIAEYEGKASVAPTSAVIKRHFARGSKDRDHEPGVFEAVIEQATRSVKDDRERRQARVRFVDSVRLKPLVQKVLTIKDVVDESVPSNKQSSRLVRRHLARAQMRQDINWKTSGTLVARELRNRLKASLTLKHERAGPQVAQSVKSYGAFVRYHVSLDSKPVYGGPTESEFMVRRKKINSKRDKRIRRLVSQPNPKFNIRYFNAYRADLTTRLRQRFRRGDRKQKPETEESAEREELADDRSQPESEVIDYRAEDEYLDVFSTERLEDAVADVTDAPPRRPATVRRVTKKEKVHVLPKRRRKRIWMERAGGRAHKPDAKNSSSRTDFVP